MAIIKGGTSGVAIDSGATSKAIYTEMLDSAGKLYGAAKVQCQWNALNFTSGSSEAILTLTPVRDGVNGSTYTTIPITSGKRLVLVGASLWMKNAGAAVQWVRCAIRINAGGAAIASSPVIAILGSGSNSAVAANSSGQGSIVLSTGFPCLMEFSGTVQIGVSQISQGSTAGNDFTMWGYEY